MDELLRPRVLNRPALSVVLGSGLGGLVKQVDVLGELSFAKIGLPNTSADGHAGTFVLGLLGERPVLLQSGRLHLYENWHAAVVALPVRIQALAGIRTFVLTNAAGSLDVSVSVGDIVVLTGDRGAQAHSPSGGLYDDAQFDGPFGPKFFPVNEAYDCTLRAKFVEHARKLSHPVHQGVYQFMLGPRYEQINEILEFARLRQQAISAGDVDHALITVGMSTAPEVCALAQLRSDQRFSSIRTLAISNVTNLAAGVAGSVPSSEEVLSAGPFGGARIIEVLRAMIPEL
jgi:inosine/guanosine/xanthosine phosphorylase family protein